MENASEGLKLAGFIILFVAALSIAMVTIMQAKRTSEDVLSYSDKSIYSSNMETIIDDDKFDNGNRIVSVYDIIPTLYRYYQEKYIVLFYNSVGTPLTIYNGPIKDESSTVNEDISYLNFELEDFRQAYWRDTTKSVKKHVDKVVKKLLENYNDSKFVETIYSTPNAYLNNSSNNSSNNIPNKNVENVRVIEYTKKQN